ncbi:hypothetical protein ACHAW5_003129 [Stephanodiscus triporus]|uniref:Uncharacterized protein n=1 Tax=Stephanodiscus triporus TaxID=2934178 RepID=A0ABD3ND75_9STRA
MALIDQLKDNEVCDCTSKNKDESERNFAVCYSLSELLDRKWFIGKYRLDSDFFVFVKETVTARATKDINQWKYDFFIRPVESHMAQRKNLTEDCQTSSSDLPNNCKVE